MRQVSLLFALTLLAGSACLPAQTAISAVDKPASPTAASSGGAVTLPYPARTVAPPTIAPFSRIAFAGGIGAMGINLQTAVNANRYMNVRGVGNFFNYSVNNVSTNGLTLSGKLNMATAGASIDFYPFPNHGFRISPGGLFYNQNALTATMIAAGGTSFTLDGYTYYSSEANPVTGSGRIGLNKQSPAFTITTGWGNMISRSGGHLSFPLEIGAAMTGSPTVNMALTSGQVCANPQGTVGCVDVVGNSTLESNLQAQVAKYQSDVNKLSFYPILSFGVGYNFSLRPGATRVAGR